MSVPQQVKIDDMDRFCEELEHVFHNFSKYHMKILVGEFNAKVGRDFETNNWEREFARNQ
jgi:hypothetical protein